MSAEADNNKLKLCLIKIIDLVEECLKNIKSIKDHSQSKTDPKDDSLLENSQLNNNIYTFALSSEDNELLDTLTSDIQTTLNQHLPRLSQRYLNYLLDFLHTYHYDRDQREFTQSLAMGELHSFHRELEGLLASVEAYEAAFEGDLQKVKKFIKKYPTHKDKPGPWETTLLYSAARNNRIDIVKYLIESAHCSINAQNQRDVNFALDVCDKDFVPKTSSASTALHGACYNQHLDIVKYLIEYGADYFIVNQANETPIMNGEAYINIKNYFQDYLIISYSIEPPRHLPDRTVMNQNERPIRDCMWEYKPFQDPKWYKFIATEATELHKASMPTEEFQQEVHLKTEKGLYSVSMIEFYRSGKHEQDPQKNMAWIRCRGSSVLNFDCYSIWQMMLIRHNKIDKNAETTPSLQVQKFPPMTDSRFKLQLNTWYSCNTKTNSLLDDSMNYRRKVISISIPFVSDKLNFNLQTFEFSNDEKTIVGYIRWIPKLISNKESDGKKIVYIDNYNVMASMQPIPLTTNRLKEISHMKKVDQQQVDGLANPEEDDDDENDESELQLSKVSDLGIDDDDVDMSNDKTKVSLKDYSNISSFLHSSFQVTSESMGTWSVTELDDNITDIFNVPLEPTESVTTDTSVREDSNLSTEEFFHEKIGQSVQATVMIERTNSTLKDETTSVLTCVLEAEILELKDQIEKEKAKVEEQKQSKHKLTTEKEQELQQTNRLLKDLQQQLLTTQTREQKLKDLTKQIKAIDYDVEIIIINNFLFGRHKQIVQHLRIKHKIDNYFVGIPNVTISEKKIYIVYR